MELRFLVLRTAVEDLGYYAVVQGTSRNWFYDAVRGELTVHARFEEPPFDLTGTTHIRDEIRPENIPADVRAAFGNALKTVVKEATDIAALLGVVIESGVYNSVTAPVTGFVGQFGNIQGGIDFRRG